MKSLLESHGGKTGASVTAQCTHLVSHTIGSAKTSKTEEAGVPVVADSFVQSGGGRTASGGREPSVHKSIADGKVATKADDFLTNGPEDGGDDGEGEDGEEGEGDGEDGEGFSAAAAKTGGKCIFPGCANPAEVTTQVQSEWECAVGLARWNVCEAPFGFVGRSGRRGR